MSEIPITLMHSSTQTIPESQTYSIVALVLYTSFSKYLKQMIVPFHLDSQNVFEWLEIYHYSSVIHLGIRKN